MAEKANRMKRVPALVISREDVRFAADSSREGAGFEPSVAQPRGDCARTAAGQSRHTGKARPEPAASL